MVTLAMLSESLAVIGHDGNNRVLVQAPRLEPGDEFSNRGIGVGDFPVIRIGSKAGLVWLRRFIRTVRIVAMHPHQERPGGVLAQPAKGMVDHLVSAPLNAVVAIFTKTASMVAGIVSVKSAIETDGGHVFWVEHH